MQKLKNRNIVKNEQHPFHLVNTSFIPISVSASLFFIALGLIKVLHYTDRYTDKWTRCVIPCILLFIFLLYCWYAEIVSESDAGHHTRQVKQGIKLGMCLFIVSEIMFFFSFFWAFFHVSLSPSVGIGCI
jgi:cytochrome c oxidase subunit 3